MNQPNIEKSCANMLHGAYCRVYSQTVATHQPKHIYSNWWRYLMVAVYRCSPSSLTELMRICQEVLDKLFKSRCGKLSETYPTRLEAAIAAKVASTKYKIKGLKAFINEIFQMRFFTLFHFFCLLVFFNTKCVKSEGDIFWSHCKRICANQLLSCSSLINMSIKQRSCPP